MRGWAAEADRDARAGGADAGRDARAGRQRQTWMRWRATRRRGGASRTFFSVAWIGASPPPATVGGGAGGLAGALETPPSAAEAAWRTAAAKVDEDTKR